MDREMTIPPLAQAWLDDALAEHASIAAFSKLSLQLMALGAPPHLLKQCHEAALDEIEHAKCCFRLASKYAGKPMGAGHFPDLLGLRIKRTTFENLAVESLVDGCLMEGWSAAVIAESAARTEDPGLQETLERIAKDENQHTKLAWDILIWALDQDPKRVQKSMRQALDTLPTRPRIKAMTGFESQGRLEAKAQLEAFLAVRESVITRAVSLFQSSPPSPPSLLNRVYKTGMKGITKRTPCP